MKMLQTLTALLLVETFIRCLISFVSSYTEHVNIGASKFTVWDGP